MESLQCHTYLSPLSQLGLSYVAGAADSGAAVSGQDLPPSVRVHREAVTAESKGDENPLQGGSNTKLRKNVILHKAKKVHKTRHITVTVHFNDIMI